MSDDGKTSGREPRFIVGIGASAGGLESLEQLFRNMPTSSEMAFVVVQHLSPDFKSMMGELLSRDTSMRIVAAEDGMPVHRDVVYLMPPKKEMLIADGCLHLSDKDSSSGLTLSIDHFFESLAREAGDRAIAIVLSGSGTDGTRGIAEVARRGGLVISESLESAKFDGMPSSAQATGLVDLVMVPAEMGNALLRFCEDPSTVQRERFDRDEEAASLRGIDAIFQLFRTVYDVDFGSYKDTTIMRRMRRRLAMLQLESFDQYAERLQSDSAELHLLYSDLLIGVTEFFRDTEVFDALINEVLPKVISSRGQNETVRAWVAGCATGEEAYSVTIALKEAMRENGDERPLKVFATDIHKRSIEKASRGYFTSDELKTLPEDYADQYFEPRSNGFQVKQELRQQIVFSPHNILRDAPFTDLDFVSCRNMLIYLRPAAQRRALSLLHYGLRTGGVLMLGSSESPGELSSEFEALHERHRIYRKSRDVRLKQNLRSPLTAPETIHRTIIPKPATRRPSPAAARTQQMHDELLNRFMPPSILIDRSRTVLDTFSGAERLLRFPSRRPTLDILELVDREVRTTVATAISRSIKQEETVRYGRVRMQNDGAEEVFEMTVEPVGAKAADRCYLVTFVRIETETAADAPAEEESAASSTDHDRAHIRQLEEDLRYARENLQNTVEELETSNEELQATNEELIASNEELQSTNEELHSLNEELYSVNAEHQRKIEQLAELNSDMEHLLENTDVATVFLDSELRIRRFTSRVQEIFDLIQEDIGRSISVFGAKFRISNLMSRLKQVLETGEAYEQEVLADSVGYLMRLLPYRTHDKVDGVVMMWIDVSSLERLRGRLRWLSAIVESTSDAIIGHDLDGSIVSWNHGAEELYGYSPQEVIGQNIDILIPEENLKEVAGYRERIMRFETVVSSDTQRLHKNGDLIDVSLTVSPVVNPGGEVIGISKIARDIGPRLQLQREIRLQVQQRERFLAMLSHELRNPVNAVSSAASVLASDNANPVERDLSTATIQRQVSIVKRLLGDLLDVARIAENRIDLKFETLDLRNLAPHVLETVQTSLDQHGCTVEFSLPDSPVYVSADRTRLIQVQVNLIQNAAKYSGTKTPIRVGMRNENGQTHLWVADDGCGIPPEMLESIFEPFAQLDDSRGQSDGGLGVGLTLAKSLIELHDGSISAESEGEGQGAVFHIWLPALDAAEVEAKNIPVKSDSSQGSYGCGDGKLRFCLVEDLEDSRLTMKTLLELSGHTVTAVPDGATGVETVLGGEFDVAMIDIGLPDMTGYDVAAKIREQANGNLPRLVALTGYGQPGDLEQAEAAGFDEHVIKPIEPGAIEQICQAVFEQREQSQNGDG